MMHLKRSKPLLLMFVGLFVALQAVKPLVMMDIYRGLTDFNPTLYDNYQLYAIVLKQTLAGGMRWNYTLIILVTELCFLLAPLCLWQLLTRVQKSPTL